MNVSDIPWAAIVGVIGTVLGTIVGAIATDKAANKRLKLEQEHADRTRFHKERVELYGKLLVATQACREVACNVQLLSPEKRREYGERGDYGPIKAAIIGLKTASSAVQLIASPRVQKAAEAIEIKCALLTIVASADEAKFHATNEELAQAESDFSDAAREELLPSRHGIKT